MAFEACKLQLRNKSSNGWSDQCDIGEAYRRGLMRLYGTEEQVAFFPNLSIKCIPSLKAALSGEAAVPTAPRS